MRTLKKDKAIYLSLRLLENHELIRVQNCNLFTFNKLRNLFVINNTS